MAPVRRRWLARAPEGVQRAAVAVEAAVVIPILIVLMMAVVDFGRFFYAQIVASQAVTEASRSLALGQDIPFAAGVVTTFLDGVPAMAGGVPSVSGTECPTDIVLDGSQRATATVSFSFNWLTPLGLLAGDTVAVLPSSVSQSAESVCRS